MFKYFIFIAILTLHAAPPIELSPYEQSLYSQNGEDGILAALFQWIPPESRYLVDLGASDGITGSNTYLLRLQGWNALLLDKAYENPNHNLYREFITQENINELFEKYKVPFEFDLLSIDLHYNDFYIWNALDPKYRPRIVVIEYNATLGSQEDKGVKYHPFFGGDGTNYFGASILSFFKLGLSKGYSLVYAESAGSNLFFIRDDLLRDLNLFFKNMNDVKTLYRPPSIPYPRGEGKNRIFIPCESL